MKQTRDAVLAAAPVDLARTIETTAAVAAGDAATAG